MNAPAPKPPAKPEDPGPLTYFLLVDDEYDEAAGREYLEEKYGPGSTKGSKRVTHIRVGRLTEEHTVIPVVRKNIALGLEKAIDPDSKRKTTVRNNPVLGMVEGTPVECCNFWEASEHEDGDGTLNMSRFLEALGKSCTPTAPKYRQDDQILRLRFT
jgi:hypothetical protein